MTSDSGEGCRFRKSLHSGQCSKCSFKITDVKIDVMREHMLQTHLNYECPSCNRTFFLQHALDQHSTRADHKTNTCKVCRKSFPARGDLLKHAGNMNHYISGRNKGTSSTNSWLCGVLTGGQKEQNLNDFMQKNVFPDKEYKTKSKEVVDRLKMFMQHNTGYSIKELFVGGSQGRKTNLQGHSDVDLVMYNNRYSTMKEFRENLPKDLEALTNHMKKDLTWAKDVNITRTTKHAVQFEVEPPGYPPIKVDLLPAPDLLQNKKLKDIYKEMKAKSAEERLYYSVCFAKKQAEFVKSVPPDVKHLTRLVKYWAKTEHVPVKSYFTELLVIDSWKSWGKPDELPIEERFLSIIHRMEDLSDVRRMRWKENDTAMETFPDLPPDGPVLLDVMNPFNNVARTGKDVREVEEKATSLLNRKPTWSTE